MRKSLIILAAILIGGVYYLQTHPEIGIKIRQTFSRENMLEPKFRHEQEQEQYRKKQSPLFFPPSNKSS